MYLKLITLAFLFHVGRCSVPVRFTKCNYNGFSCVNVNKKVAVTYSCISSANDPTFYINQFGAPSNIQSLTITKCPKLTISMKCTSENRPMDFLKITNIDQLTIQKLPYQSHLPPTVIFENISKIETIPSFTFTQVNKNMHSPGCTLPQKDFETLLFRNVTIETIQSNAFLATTAFKNFSFDRVKVDRMQNSAIDVRLDPKNVFFIQRSRFDILEHLAFQVQANKTFFSQNKFVDIASSGINGTTETFYFINNTVNTVQSNGFALLTTNAYIIRNEFEYLKSGAFEKITPGLIKDSGRSFGTLKFVYDFSRNVIRYMDAGCLHPDIVAYENVATEMVFNKNEMLCTCENIGWLVAEIGHGQNAISVEVFYEMVLDETYENICSDSCNLPVNKVKSLIQNGKCLSRVSVTNLCFVGTTEMLQENSSVASLDDDKTLIESLTYSGSDIKGFHCMSFIFSIVFVMVK